MTVSRYYLKTFPITSKFRNYCNQNHYNATDVIAEAIHQLCDINPLILFVRPVRLDDKITVKVDSETYKKYNELKSYLTVEGLSMLINDIVINKPEYTVAINKSVELRGVIIGNLSEIDALILEDATLTEKEKKFLIELDNDMKELLYYDREMLAKTDIE